MSKANSKRMRAINEKLEANKVYSVDEAITLLATLSALKFEESFDVSVNLGVDARKSEQAVRGSVVLPHGTGKTVKVAVFTQGEKADLAKQAGADYVGFDDLAEQVKAGEFDADIVIATPDAMKVVGKLGAVLGPKGLMPNPKDGTVSQDVAEAVKNAKAGQVRFRTDKNGIIHCGVGKLKFSSDKIKENVQSLLLTLKKIKPASVKGVYIKKLVLSTTMGPGLRVDLSSLDI
jgi:large subunit ribosomal protein L1